MVDISIVDGGYKLTNITGGYHIVWKIAHLQMIFPLKPPFIMDFP